MSSNVIPIRNRSKLFKQIIKNTSLDNKGLRKIVSWVANNISYRSNNEEGSYQIPEATLARGTGDCDDMAVLIAQAVVKLGASPKDVYIVSGIIDTPLTTSGVGHAVCQYGGMYLCPFLGVKKRLPEFKQSYRGSLANLAEESVRV